MAAEIEENITFFTISRKRLEMETQIQRYIVKVARPEGINAKTALYGTNGAQTRHCRAVIFIMGFLGDY